MIYITEQDLVANLELWFKSQDKRDDKFYRANPVLNCLRDNLRDWGHWKGKPRGNPIKGREQYKKNEIKRLSEPPEDMGENW